MIRTSKKLFLMALSLMGVMHCLSQKLIEDNHFGPVELYQSISTKSANAGSLVYNYCDEDGDGYYELNLELIRNEVLANYGVNGTDNEAILISTSGGQLLKVDNPSGTPTTTVMCGIGYPMTDVAVDEEGQTYGTQFGSIFKLDDETCDSDIIFTFPFGSIINSLSFDINGNMYYGTGDSPKVYRWDASEPSNASIWHNFSSGAAGGDFVIVNGKMYIAWNINDDFRLYEVTVDADFNYISHIDLGEIPENTFGLASELGSLYGVSEEKLYRINLDTFTFTDILENNSNNNEWYGAAGLHEAVILEATSHVSHADATSNINSLPNSWVNTTQGGQIIYIRIENTTTGEYVILEVQINIFSTPQISKPSDLQQCTDDPSGSIFDLSEVEDELLINVSQDVVISYHNRYEKAFDGIDPIGPLYQSSLLQEIIYVRVQNVNDPCFAITDFLITNNLAPNLAPLVTDASERSLIACYIDRFDQGYFKLNEIYNDIVLDESQDYNLQFYRTYSDAENEINPLPDIYYSTIHLIEEIFVKVTNEEGCSEISNFFINGDCVLYTEDISNIHFPKFFTPNEDSYNDYWNISGASVKVKEETVIQMFDRHGKLLLSFRPLRSKGWDGRYNGNPLPSSDYWYKVITPLGNTYSGHVTLKR